MLLVAYALRTDAVEHARTPFEVTVGFDGTSVVVAVSDESPLLPDLQPLNLRATRGRGLQMVPPWPRAGPACPTRAARPSAR